MVKEQNQVVLIDVSSLESQYLKYLVKLDKYTTPVNLSGVNYPLLKEYLQISS